MPRRRPTTADARSESPAAPATVALVSLGCPKNLVDSEKMLGLLAEAGCVPVPSDAPADAVIINTCGFLEASKDESLGEIHDAIARKQRGEVKRVVVAGCLVQRHRAKLLDWAPGIDALIGVYDRDRVVDAVAGPLQQTPDADDAPANPDHPLPVYSSIAASAVTAKRQRHLGPEAKGYFESDAARLRLTPRHYAYLRMSEGCNQNCAFCTIPSIRGKMRSKPVDAITAELHELLTDGAVEINLIGQDTTSYGDDIGYGPGLAGLLTALDRATQQHGPPGSHWLRLMYAYPSCFTDAMIDAIAALPSVVKYIDMPLQHINDAVLDRMRRRTSRKLIETLLDKLRTRVPGITIRTTFISGFPGETAAQHRELVDFVRHADFGALGVFPYSPEPGTPAGSLHAAGEAIAPEVIQQRVEEIMLTQQEAVFARNAAVAAGRTEAEVLVEGRHEVTQARSRGAKKAERYAGRTQGQAPQIDAVTIVESREELSPGELVRCRVTGHEGYDLVARPVSEIDAPRRRALPVLRS